jgi:hypothetical protein
LEDSVIAAPRLTAPAEATVSDSVEASRPNRRNTQVANTMVVLVGSMPGILGALFRELVMGEGLTIVEANKPESVDDVETEPVSGFGCSAFSDSLPVALNRQEVRPLAVEGSSSVR